MPFSCSVPKCEGNSYKFKAKRSTFKVPSDPILRKEWETCVPGVVFRSTARICERHFSDENIIRECVKYDQNGRIIYRAPLKHPRLRNGAKPTVFNKPNACEKSMECLRQPLQSIENRIFNHEEREEVKKSQVKYEQNNCSVSGINLQENGLNVSTDIVNFDSLSDVQATVVQKDNVLLSPIQFEQFHLQGTSGGDTGDNIGNVPLNNYIYHLSSLTSTSAVITNNREEYISSLTSKSERFDTQLIETTDSSVCEYNTDCNNKVETEPISKNCDEVIQSDFDCKENSLENNNVEDTSNNDSALQFISVTFKSITPSSITSMSFNFSFKPGEDMFAECSIEVPKPWNVSQSSIGEKETLLFTWVTSVNDNGITKHILEKCLIITADREIKYEVHSTPVHVNAKILPTILHDIKSLPELLRKFKDMRVCKGVHLSNVPQNSILKNSLSREWHHADCTMLSINYERCPVCRRMTKSLSQKARRFKKLEKEKYKRIPASKNSLDQIKLKMLQKKLKCRTRRAKNYKRRLDTLIETISQKQQNIANINVVGFEMKCSSHKISDNQKIVMNEIISAAKRTSPNGRRYSEEFIMLCMLMNIRSTSFYEFLRKNEILPLPCTKTIRDYTSLIKTTCGFDEAFFQLLAKSFKTKNIMKRHGVLLLDEIGLRKAIAVSTKNLTYTGIADYGSDGPKSSDMNDLATHGLVLMYQSLTDKYTQPIAVFASKNSVSGDELAKLVVKAICLLENAGALIHAIIGDGATTNDKMWKVLGVDGSAENTKTWFTHPCSDDRKIFIFSDTPHLIKCIRNRLFNNGHLRVDPEEGEIRWDYFVHLFNIDSSQPGNARVCPKISRRHIELDNTGKMRVRYATQIFSNSVVAGLLFYLRKNITSFEGCEATAKFCKRINNLFDALNRKQPNEGLRPGSSDFKILKDTLEWLNQWEENVKNGIIGKDEFLTPQTARRLRITITSTLEICQYLIDTQNFQYLLTGKVNQDNLEKFFGTIRQAGGTNDHPTCPTFLHLYKLLSVYSAIKPPIYGNCTVTEKKFENVITITDIKNIYKKSESRTSTILQDLKQRLDNIIKNDDWEADEVIEQDESSGDFMSPVLNCVIYYVTGYLVKQVLKNKDYASCNVCQESLKNSKSDCESSVMQLVNLKTRGGLIHPNLHFFHLINHVEQCFIKHASKNDVFNLTMDEVLQSYNFTFPCAKHASDILAYSLFYYIRLRMRQFTHQENQKVKKKSVVKRKSAKFEKD